MKMDMNGVCLLAASLLARLALAIGVIGPEGQEQRHYTEQRGAEA